MTNVRHTVAKVALALMMTGSLAVAAPGVAGAAQGTGCLLYTSDAADE